MENRLLPVLLLIILNVKIWIAFQYRFAIWDGYIYLLNARRFLYGYDPYSFFEILRPPLLPYMIAFVWRLTGESFLVAEAIQPIFTVAGAGVLYLLLKEMFGYKPAFIASLFVLSIPEVFLWTNQILVHGEGLFLITASVYFFWRAINGKRKYYPLAAGSLALVTLVRYTTLVIVPVFPLMLVAHDWSSIKKRLKQLRGGGFRQLQPSFWVSVAIFVFVSLWFPWLLWNYSNVGGNPFASLQAGLISGVNLPEPVSAPPWYFYIENIPALLGIPGTVLLAIGLIDKKTFKDKAHLILLLWITVFFIFHSAIANKQTRFYIEWTPPLAAFVALGIMRVEKRLPSRGKVLGWALIVLWLCGNYAVAIDGSLHTSVFSVAKQYEFIGNYDEFIQVVKWIDANTNHSAVGASDISPYISYYSNRLFYDTTWIALESSARGITQDEFMKQIGVQIIVVRSTYIKYNRNLYGDPGLALMKSYSDFLIFGFVS